VPLALPAFLLATRADFRLHSLDDFLLGDADEDGRVERSTVLAPPVLAYPSVFCFSESQDVSAKIIKTKTGRFRKPASTFWITKAGPSKSIDNTTKLNAVIAKSVSINRKVMNRLGCFRFEPVTESFVVECLNSEHCSVCFIVATGMELEWPAVDCDGPQVQFASGNAGLSLDLDVVELAVESCSSSSVCLSL
jgi:hypothetical protein